MNHVRLPILRGILAGVVSGRSLVQRAITLICLALLTAGCGGDRKITLYIGTPTAEGADISVDVPPPATPQQSSPPAANPVVNRAAGPGPRIDLWYGPDQTFGAVGVPQSAINILGNVSDPTGIASLTYSFDEAGNYPLTIGPDGFRLVAPGDFDVALQLADVPVGANTVTLHALDKAETALTRRFIFRLSRREYGRCRIRRIGREVRPRPVR